jgi:hypothetical protein
MENRYVEGLCDCSDVESNNQSTRRIHCRDGYKPTIHSNSCQYWGL